MKYLSVRRSVLFMVVGLAVFGVYLYFFIGTQNLLTFLDTVNWSQVAIFYSLSLVAILLSVFFWSAAWNTILRSLGIYINYRRTYLYYWVGYFTDLVLPCATVCGELTRLYLVERHTKKGYGTLASVAITNRIVAYTIVTIGLYSGAVLIFLKPGIPSIIANIFVFFLIGVTAYMAALLYLAYVKSAAANLTKIYHQILKIVSPKRYEQIKAQGINQSLESYYNGFKKFRENRRLLIRPFIYHLISYLLGLSSYILIFYALGIPSPTPEFYIVVYFIATAVQDAAASFSVGSLDIILASIFILYGLNPGVSGTTALLLRSAGFWFPLVVGLICVQILGTRNIITKATERREPKPQSKKNESQQIVEKKEIVAPQRSPSTQNEKKLAKPNEPKPAMVVLNVKFELPKQKPRKKKKSR